MTTNLQYLNNTLLFESVGTVSSVGRDDKGPFVVLDQTIFYPQGGGQRADKGVLVNRDRNEIFLTFVGFHDGEVLHYVPEAMAANFVVGESLILRVDGGYRLANARLHTAGHLVSHVLESISPSFIPIKGYHFGDGPYVEFINSDGADANQYLADVNDRIVTAISRDIAVLAEYTESHTIHKIRPHLAPFIPSGKPSRIVTVGDFIPLPCGGTHIPTLGELKGLRVTKAKRAKDNVRISYQLAA